MGIQHLMTVHIKTPLEAGFVHISAWPAFMPTRAHAVAGTDLDAAAASDRTLGWPLGWNQPLPPFSSGAGTAVGSPVSASVLSRLHAEKRTMAVANATSSHCKQRGCL